MYAREVDGRLLTFAVSGLLWNRSLVMYDKETGSLWSHILGEAKQGRLRGKKLEQIPSVMTDWDTWRRRHPDSTVVMLSRTSSEYRREFYRSPEQFVLGIVTEGEAKAWTFDLLSRTPALNEKLNRVPILIAFDRVSVTARLYDRTVNGQMLTFQSDGARLKDQETGSTWETITGKAVTGPLAGQYLKAMPAIVSYRHVWLKFHPESSVRQR